MATEYNLNKEILSVTSAAPTPGIPAGAVVRYNPKNQIVSYEVGGGGGGGDTFTVNIDDSFIGEITTSIAEISDYIEKGFLKLDGKVYAKADYPELHDWILNNPNTIIASWANPTQFTLPNYSGRFFRASDGTGIHTSGIAGTVKDDAIRNITGGGVIGGGNYAASGAFKDIGNTGAPIGAGSRGTFYATLDVSLIVPTDTENVPYSVSVEYYIKAKNIVKGRQDIVAKPAIGITYAINDVINYNGNLYKAKVGTTWTGTFTDWAAITGSVTSTSEVEVTDPSLEGLSGIALKQDIVNKESVQSIKDLQANKVDKITGKGLTTNDFTDSYITDIQSKQAISNMSQIVGTSTTKYPSDKAVSDAISTVVVNSVVQPQSQIYFATGNGTPNGTFSVTEPTTTQIYNFPVSTTSTLRNTFSFSYPAAGFVSSLSTWQLVLKLTGLQNQTDYFISGSLILIRAGQSDFILSQNTTFAFSTGNSQTQTQITIPFLDNNISDVTAKLNYLAGDRVEMRLNWNKANGGTQSINMVSSATNPCTLIRNGGEVGSTLVLDNNGVDTKTQSQRNREYEANIDTKVPLTAMNISSNEVWTGGYDEFTGKKIYQKTIDCGALPDTSSKIVPHNILNYDNMLRIYGTSNNGVGGNSIPLPFLHLNLPESVQLAVLAGDVNLITGSNRSSYTRTFVTLEYTCTDR